MPATQSEGYDKESISKMKFKIKTPLGVYKYKMVPLFAGVKLIDKEISRHNLILFYDTLAENGIKVFLAYGTMLGAAREHDFIDHDEDIDLGMSKEYEQKLFSLLFRLRELGFEVCRYDRRGVISFMKEGEYIDIYIYSKEAEGIVGCGQEVMPECFLDNLSEFEFLGKKYLAPSEWEKYLEYWYGANWKTPVKFYQYEMPAWKKKVLVTAQYVKEFLPDPIFYALIKKKTQKYRAPYEKKIKELYLNH